jgi:hypothetical protein
MDEVGYQSYLAIAVCLDAIQEQPAAAARSKTAGPLIGTGR